MQLGENPIRLAVFASAKRLEAECLQILPAALLRSISAPHSFYPSAGMRSSCQSLRVQYSRFCEDIFALFQSTNGLCGQAAFPPIQTAAVFLFSLIIVLYGTTIEIRNTLDSSKKNIIRTEVFRNGVKTACTEYDHDAYGNVTCERRYLRV